MAAINSVIELGTSKVICLIDSHNIKGMDLPGAACIRYDGIRKASFLNPSGVREAVQSAVETAEGKCRRSVRSATVSVPGCFTRVALREGSIDVPGGRVSQDDIGTLIRKLMPEFDENWVLIDVRPAYFADDSGDIYVDAPINHKTAKLTACISFVGAYKGYLDTVSVVLADLKIDIDRFASEAYAQSLYYIPEKVRDSSVILLDVGYYDTNVSAVYGDALMAHEVIHQGGANMTEDLQSFLHIDQVVAESLKRSHIFGIGVSRGSKAYGKNSKGRMESFDALTVKDVLESRAERICAMISAKIESFSGLVSQEAPIYICGAGMIARGAETFIQTKLGRRVLRQRAKRQNMLSPVYYSAMALLDNSSVSVYYLSERIVLDRLKNNKKSFF